MRVKRANIDSLNLSSSFIESTIHNESNYIIEDIKTQSVFKANKWKEMFGKPLTRNIIEAKVIHTNLGLTLPLKTFSITPSIQTIEFAGLHGYNERSKHLKIHLEELKEFFQYTRVTRLDIAIDFKDKIPNNIIKALSKHRKSFTYGNTTYYKTNKEKKTNSYFDIKIYNKALKEKLDYSLYRVEFCFKPKYLKKLLFKDIESIYPKLKKAIKKAINLQVEIR